MKRFSRFLRLSCFSRYAAFFAIFILLGFSGSAQDAKKVTRNYVGDTSCKTCHVSVMKSFDGNIHEKAYEVLKGDERFKKLKDEGNLSRCFPCHVTGYGEKGGFISEDETPEMAQISCEGCHGAGSEHAALGADKKELKQKTIKRYPVCWKCHLIHRHEN